MRDIEKHNPQLAGVLPKINNLFTGTLLQELPKRVSEIPSSLDYDAFGRIYEYFLSDFTRREGQGCGKPSESSTTTGTVAGRLSVWNSRNHFYTFGSIVGHLTEVIETMTAASSTARADRAACSSLRRASCRTDFNQL